jgi:hypothetical protein
MDENWSKVPDEIMKSMATTNEGQLGKGYEYL